MRWTSLTGLAYRSDRWHPENPRNPTFKPRISSKLRSNSMKLGGKLRSYPKNVSPRDLTLKISIAREFQDDIKRDGVFSRTQEIEFERASDSRGFSTGLEARESQQRTRSLLAIKCTKNEIEIHHTRAQNEEMGLIQKTQRARGG